jgi:hypothetical protein
MRIEAEVLDLPIPFGMRIAQTFDVDAAREPPFDRCLDELRSQKRKRECQIDLAHRASFAFGQLCGISDGARDDIIEPAASARDGADETRASIGALGANVFPGRPVRHQESPQSR